MLKRNEIVKDVEKLYQEPRNVLEDADLSDADKLKVLENWKADLVELLTASDENMPSSQADAGSVADRLQGVVEAIEILRAE